MALIDSSYTHPPWYLFNGHLQTIVASRWRPIEVPKYRRERLELEDGDFLDLDWLDGDRDKVVVLTHGLEGNTSRPYMIGVARFFSERGWTVLAWNCRSCSGEMNRKKRLYHHGEIEDIQSIITHLNQKLNPKNIALVGFSMGGSISLKYLGVLGAQAASNVKCAIAFSPPSKLVESVKSVEKTSNFLYHQTFLKRLAKKIRRKHEDFPDLFDIDKLDRVRTWMEFDTWFTCPINGFDHAEEFYYEASCANFVHGIRRPALLVNAENDPICPPSCNPRELAKDHDFLHLETPLQGGHVGFSFRSLRDSWMERRAWVFIHDVLEGRLQEVLPTV